MTRVMFMPPDNGGLMEFPPVSGVIDLPGFDAVDPPAKLSVSLSRRRGQTYRDVWLLVGLHRLGIRVPGVEAPLLEERVHVYEFHGLSIV